MGLLIEDIIRDREQRLKEYEAIGQAKLPQWAKDVLTFRDLTSEEWLAVRHGLIEFPDPYDPIDLTTCPF